MRLFKVYNGDESDCELAFAMNHRQAASIAKTVWNENGYRCRTSRWSSFACLQASRKGVRRSAWCMNRQPHRRCIAGSSVSP